MTSQTNCSRAMRYTTLLLILSLAAPRLGRAADANVQRLEWNTFLTDWHVLGPFPIGSDTVGLDMNFAGTESTLRGGQARIHDGTLYRWTPYDAGLIDFRKAPQSEQ